MHAEAMMSTHPQVQGAVDPVLTHAIEACIDCAQVCRACADACLGEEMVAMMRRCIRLDLDCADLCDATASILARRTSSNDEVLKHLVDTCAEACRICADECAKHGQQHEHCKVCAETCRACEQACRDASPAILLPRQ
ncbi:MAG: four-helix bundle copper-binding protein [Proteobacteria bacterium]|nr:four-helix bundle copper-binding protein [Pseudomonadota bacterium]